MVRILLIFTLVICSNSCRQKQGITLKESISITENEQTNSNFCKLAININKEDLDDFLYFKDGEYKSINGISIQVVRGNSKLEYGGVSYDDLQIKDLEKNVTIIDVFVCLEEGIYNEIVLTSNDTIPLAFPLDFLDNQKKLEGYAVPMDGINKFATFYNKEIVCDLLIVKEFVKIPNSNFFFPPIENEIKVYIDRYYWVDGLGIIGFSIFDGSTSKQYFLN